MRSALLFALLLIGACSKGPAADLPSIGEARSLGAEWALVNAEAARGHLTRTYVDTMHAKLRAQLRSAASALANPREPYGVEIHALLVEPDDASPSRLLVHVEKLKSIEDGLESA
jgi:hypothetical protein